MSGTSLDGIDAAILDTDGEAVAKPGLALSVPYDARTRSSLRKTLELAAIIARDGPVPAEIRSA